MTKTTDDQIQRRWQAPSRADDTSAILDVRQLQAMILGKDDTIAELRANLATLRGEIQALKMTFGDDAGSLAEASLPVGVTFPSREDRAAVLPAALIHAQARLEAMSPNHEQYRRTREENRELTAALVERARFMRDELQKAPDLYRPSQFWEKFFEYNMAALEDAGLANFKLTVNQTYQNFIPQSLFDKKVRFLLRWFRRNPSLRPLFSLIFNPDRATREGYLALPATQIFADDDRRMAIYRVLVTLGWEYARAHDPLAICDRLAEPELGNPIRVLHRGRLISQDLATSATEVSAFVPPLRTRIGERPISVLEIGGGYGRLAHAMMSTQDVSRYVIVDIPPALHVSNWYLRQLFPQKRFFDFRPFDVWSEVAEEAEQADVLFLLSHQIEHLPDGFVDLSVAVSSLHEMRLDQADNYLHQMGRVSRHVIASKQYWTYRNPYDDIVLKQEDYRLPAGFRRASLAEDALNGSFFIEILARDGGGAGGV